jgi:hypothetical protein
LHQKHDYIKMIFYQKRKNVVLVLGLREMKFKFLLKERSIIISNNILYIRARMCVIFFFTISWIWFGGQFWHGFSPFPIAIVENVCILTYTKRTILFKHFLKRKSVIFSRILLCKTTLYRRFLYRYRKKKIVAKTKEDKI